MIVSFVSLKGGVGKTTLAINTAVEFAESGYKTLLIDADPQESVDAWAEMRGTLGLDLPMTVVKICREKMAKDVERIAADYDRVVIDAGGRAEGVARSCIIAADLVLVPMEPHTFSSKSALNTLKQIEAAIEYKPEIMAAYVVNKLHTAARADKVGRLLSWLEPLDTAVRLRAVYSHATGEGRTLREMKAAGKPALKEIKSLVKEIPNG